MVSAGDALGGVVSLPSGQPGPLIAYTTIPSHLRYPIPSWSPRQGRGMAYFKWHDAVLKLAAAFGLTPDELSDELVSDTLDSASSPSTPGYSPFRSVVALRSADGALRRLTAEQLDHWKTVNTALYWHVLPSLNLDSAQLLSDMRKVNSFFLLWPACRWARPAPLGVLVCRCLRT